MATKYWRGGAAAVAQVTTLTFAGTWATADTYSFKIGGKQLLLTVGSAVTPTDVATQFYNAFNSSDVSTGLGAGYSASSGGQNIPEFQGIVATNPSAGVVTLTGLATGVPFTYASLATTAGTGDVTPADTVAATGPNHLNNAQNYLGGALPVDNDVLVFDSGAVSALYALDYFRTGNIDLDVKIYGTWTGQLGLPPVNTVGYPEYRGRYFKWRGQSKTLEVLAASDGSTSQSPLWIDAEDQTGASILITGGRGVSQAPSIFITGGASTPLAAFVVEAGSVSVEPPDASVTTRFRAAGSQIGKAGGGQNDCFLILNENATTYKGSQLIQYSGTIDNFSQLNDGVDATTLTIAGGVFNQRALTSINGAPAINLVSVWIGATFNLIGAADITLLNLEGTLDLRGGSNRLLTSITEIIAHRSSAIFDPAGRAVGKASATVQFDGCGPQDLQAFQVGPDTTWTQA